MKQKRCAEQVTLRDPMWQVKSHEELYTPLHFYLFMQAAGLTDSQLMDTRSSVDDESLTMTSTSHASSLSQRTPKVLLAALCSSM